MIQFKIRHDETHEFIEPEWIDFETVAHLENQPFLSTMFGHSTLDALNERGGLTIFELWCLENKVMPQQIFTGAGLIHQPPPRAVPKLFKQEVDQIQTWFDRWSESRFKYTVRPTE